MLGESENRDLRMKGLSLLLLFRRYRQVRIRISEKGVDLAARRCEEKKSKKSFDCGVKDL